MKAIETFPLKTTKQRFKSPLQKPPSQPSLTSNYLFFYWIGILYNWFQGSIQMVITMVLFLTFNI